MARYFGGFRDRLKKKNRNLSLSEKDIEWLEVATTFSWAPARRDYQWLEPEDYLSSFLNSNVSESDFSSGPAGDGVAGENNANFFHGNDANIYALPEEESSPDYSSTYDFSSMPPEDDALTSPSVEIPADLPHLDEYKLEINSALQRRGIQIEPDQIKVPEELAFHLNNYHEKGRSTIDSYELRARLQNYKKQVIESYEYSAHTPNPFLTFEETNATDSQLSTKQPESNVDTKDYESFIVSSLDRLEESMKGEGVDSEVTPSENLPAEKNPHKPSEEDANLPPSAFFSEPPSSFADDSWLVLPVDSTGPASRFPDTQDNSSQEDVEWDIFKGDKINSTPKEKKTAEEDQAPKSLFKRPQNDVSNGLLEALNTINSNLTDNSEDADQDLDKPIEFFSSNSVLPNEEEDLRTPDAKEKTPENSADIPPKKKKALFQRSDPRHGEEGRKEVKLNSRLKEEGLLGQTTRKEVTFKHKPTNQQSQGESSRKEVRFPDAFSVDSRKEPESKPTSGEGPGFPEVEDGFTLDPLTQKNKVNDGDRSGRVEVKLVDRLNPDPLPASYKEEENSVKDSLLAEEEIKEEKRNEPLQDLNDDTSLSDLLLRLRHEGDSSRKNELQDQPSSSIQTEDAVPETGSDLLAFDFDATNKADADEVIQDHVEASHPEHDRENLEDEIGSDHELDQEIRETVEQKRARFIEEERKKLYSLIGRLEHSAENLEIDERSKKPVEPVQDDVVDQQNKQDFLRHEYVDTASLEEVSSEVFPVEQQKDEEAFAVEIGNDDNLEIEEEYPILEKQTPEIAPLPAPISEITHRDDVDVTDTEEEETEDIYPEEENALTVEEPPEDLLSTAFFAAQGSESSMNEEKVVMPQSQNTNDVSTVEEQVNAIPPTELDLVSSEKTESAPEGMLIETTGPSAASFDDMTPDGEGLEGVVECLAFAAEEPIPLKRIARIYSEVQGVRMPTDEEVMVAIEKLNALYEKEGRSFRIKMWGRGVRMATHPQYAKYIRAIYQDNRPKKLSRTLMETLSIIAYSQPTTKPEIDFVRGVDSDYAVRKLLEIGLIDIVGRSDSIGRPLLYGTSERFLDQFGLSELDALPKLREVEELLGDPAFQKERLHLLALEGIEEKGGDNKESTQPDDSTSAEKE